MDKSDGSLELLPGHYPLGQVVLSRRGKDRGRFYVVVGFEKDRLALADGDRFNVSRPKRKNPRHVQRTSRCAAELVELIGAKRDIDRGRFCQVLAGLRDAPAEG
ncbi:MAG: KOW domain-containing RNA-binding protein [Fretibacterium sp.]|nr:KOW domain-containing RNA-binding protein [Fretibacterium sp.]